MISRRTGRGAKREKRANEVRLVSPRMFDGLFLERAALPGMRIFCRFSAYPSASIRIHMRRWPPFTRRRVARELHYSKPNDFKVGHFTSSENLQQREARKNNH